MADVRFYNAGGRIQETLKFSLPDTYGRDAIGYKHLDLPKEDFFEIEGDQVIDGIEYAVRFAEDISRKFGERGVVRIVDKKFAERRGWKDDDAIPDDQPYGFTEKTAAAKGKALWRKYTRAVADSWIAEALEARAKGGVLRKATAFTAFCLELHGLVDPADELYHKVVAGQRGADPQVGELQKQLEEERTARHQLEEKFNKLLDKLGGGEEDEKKGGDATVQRSGRARS